MADSPPSGTEKVARLGVLLPLPFDAPFDYRVPAGLALAPGDFVRVPFGRGERVGVVWGAAADFPEGRLKAIAERLDVPPLPEPVRRLVDWVAAYTLAPRGLVLKMAMSVPGALAPPAPAVALALAEEMPAIRWTAARGRVRAVLAGGPPRGVADLAREAAVSPAVVRGLAKAGALREVSLFLPPAIGIPDGARPGPRLSPTQEQAARALCARVAEDTFSVTVLDGVPGSGKTEVYFEAVAAALAQGRQVLVLLPEIALTAQWLARFRERFGAAPAVWHSELTPARRREIWRAVARGEAPVVVGARSALFLPFPALGLIVVDEEHDASYKQEEGVIYNARDMAVVRARLTGIPTILSSATPSLETLRNVERARYGVLHLPDRHAEAVPATVEVVDMRRDAPPRGAWLSPPLRQAVAETLAGGGQVLLFLNRRGYAPLTLCRACGHRLQCPRCTAWLVEHRRSAEGPGRLECHHCGFAVNSPRTCPSCEAEDSFAACGPGVERLAEEAASLFPEARLAIAASDTLAGPRAARDLVRRIEAHAVDLIVGTQIVAKGYHFPLLTLVGVVDADLGLAGGDLRAAERTFQLLYQVAGRAGRAVRPGRVLLQTYGPEHPVIGALAAGDRDRFLAAESAARQTAGMPPFGRLVALIVAARDEARLDAFCRDLARAAPRRADIQIWGPAPAPLALLRGRHRRRFLVKGPRGENLQALVRSWLAAVPMPNGVKLAVDVDPYGFL